MKKIDSIKKKQRGLIQKEMEGIMIRPVTVIPKKEKNTRTTNLLVFQKTAKEHVIIRTTKVLVMRATTAKITIRMMMITKVWMLVALGRNAHQQMIHHITINEKEESTGKTITRINEKKLILQLH